MSTTYSSAKISQRTAEHDEERFVVTVFQGLDIVAAYDVAEDITPGQVWELVHLTDPKNLKDQRFGTLRTPVSVAEIKAEPVTDALHETGMTVAEVIKEARSWIADCEWGDLDPEDIEHLPVATIKRGVQRHHEGGWLGFLQCLA